MSFTGSWRRGLFAISILATLGPTQTARATEADDRRPIRERLEVRRAEDEPARSLLPGDYSFTLRHGGTDRQYLVHVPNGYDPEIPAPLVMSFHGGGGNMTIQATDEYYGLISKSDKAGFIAVFPNGYSRLRNGGLATWNAGNCCGTARDRAIDDVGFVRAVLDDVGRRTNVDPRRIFASGISNGAMMAYRLACEMSATFTAITAVAGTDNTMTCSPTRPVSILHIHARDDELVLFNGGAGRDSPIVTDFVSVPASIAKWVRSNGCSEVPRRVMENEGAYCDAYRQCRGGVEVRLCVTETGGHSWPGGTKPRGGKAGSSALSATDEMWDFFSGR